MSVAPRGMSIQEAYGVYRSGNFQVNRRYQRKLVWLPSEKEALVDSILQGFPIPLILLAFEMRSDGTKKFEILDGMQRLNAIFSFIENEFAWEHKYFDTDENSRAKQLAESSAIVAKRDKATLLSAPHCARFLEYTLAVTEFPATNEAAVNEVFSRINSYGRQLSDQEKRQAGIVSALANLVREIGAEIRGDVSHERLDLADMPGISIATPSADFPYGISASETFWCKQGILSANQLRDSEDEQMIADLVISVLEESPFAFSGRSLDKYYDSKAEECIQINDLLAAYGPAALRQQIVSTFSVLREVIEESDPNRGALKRVVHPESGSNPIKTAFYSIFMAFFDLCVRERKTPRSSADVMAALDRLQDRLKVAAGQVSTEMREQNIAVTKGLIQKCFIETDPPAISHGGGSVMAFENAMRRSRIETSRFECKQGVLPLKGDRKLNMGLLDRLVMTACAIANVGPDSEGAIFIGVADSESDKIVIESVDQISALKIGARHVVGIDREVRVLGEDIEKYKKRIVSHFRASNLSPLLCSAILSSIDCITYRGLEVICIPIPAQPQISQLGDKVYERQGSDTVEATSNTRVLAVNARFVTKPHLPTKVIELVETRSSTTEGQIGASKREPAKSKPAKSKPAKSKLAKSKPAKSKPAKAKPAKSKPAKSKPARGRQ